MHTCVSKSAPCLLQVYWTIIKNEGTELEEATNLVRFRLSKDIRLGRGHPAVQLCRLLINIPRELSLACT